MPDNKIIVDGKEYELSNIYGSKHDADRDAEEFNHTGRWSAIVQPTDNGYALYTRKLTPKNRIYIKGA